MAKRKIEANLSINERLEHALIPNWNEPYKLPDNWCWCEVGAICEIVNGYAFKSNKFVSDFGVPVVRIANISEGFVDIGDCVYTSEIVDDRFVIEQGDLLIAMSGATTGKNGVYNNVDKAFLNQRVGNVKVKYPKLLNVRFRNYYFANVQQEIFNLAHGGAQPNISAEKIEQMVFPLPPYYEQERIVERIESLFAKLDEAKDKAQEVVDDFEIRKAAILHNAFSGKLTSKWRSDNGKSIDEWEELSLDDVANYKKGPFGSSITKAMFVPKGENTYKVYEQGNAIRKTLDYGSYYINSEKYEELKGFAVKAGDIIVSCAGTIGEIYKLPYNCEEGVINQALMRIRVYNNIDEQFFMYYFAGILKGDIINESNGTAIKNIPPFKVLKAKKIILPSLPEQKQIASVLERILLREQHAKEIAEVVIKEIETMKKAILAKAFRGELGTNVANEESSLKVLKSTINDDVTSKKEIRVAGKKIIIPSEVKLLISNVLEEEIIKLLIKFEPEAISVHEIMALSLKKFELMEALRNLEKKNLIFYNEEGKYLLKR